MRYKYIYNSKFLEEHSEVLGLSRPLRLEVPRPLSWKSLARGHFEATWLEITCSRTLRSHLAQNHVLQGPLGSKSFDRSQKPKPLGWKSWENTVPVQKSELRGHLARGSKSFKNSEAAWLEITCSRLLRSHLARNHALQGPLGSKSLELKATSKPL